MATLGAVPELTGPSPLHPSATPNTPSQPLSSSNEDPKPCSSRSRLLQPEPGHSCPRHASLLLPHTRAREASRVPAPAAILHRYLLPCNQDSSLRTLILTLASRERRPRPPVPLSQFLYHASPPRQFCPTALQPQPAAIRQLRGSLTLMIILAIRSPSRDWPSRPRLSRRHLSCPDLSRTAIPAAPSIATLTDSSSPNDQTSPDTPGLGYPSKTESSEALPNNPASSSTPDDFGDLAPPGHHQNHPRKPRIKLRQPPRTWPDHQTTPHSRTSPPQPLPSPDAPPPVSLSPRQRSTAKPPARSKDPAGRLPSQPPNPRLPPRSKPLPGPGSPDGPPTTPGDRSSPRRPDGLKTAAPISLPPSEP